MDQNTGALLVLLLAISFLHVFFAVFPATMITLHPNILSTYADTCITGRSIPSQN